MTIKPYNCRIEYTEHSDVTTELIVYAHSPDDADAIARMQFLDRRRDSPTIRHVAVAEAK
jgi:hypothetical protein